MKLDMQRTELMMRLLVTATVILLVFFAGGRTHWETLTEAADIGVTDVSAGVLPGGESLISAALAAGELDEETALLYRVYSLYGDERLPHAYRSTVTETLDGGVMCEVVARWDALSQSTREKLAPFLALVAPGGDAGLGCTP